MSFSNHPLHADKKEIISNNSYAPKFRFRVIFYLLIALIALAFWIEAQTSLIQAHILPPYAKTLTYELQEGPTSSVHYPLEGPFDIRLGYSRLPRYLERLQTAGMKIDAQVKMSDSLLEYLALDLNVPYEEKTNAGLVIKDVQGELIYQFHYPQWSYKRFEDIPPIVWQTLLFIEDREVLGTSHPYHNPAIDWARFLKAAAFKAGEYIQIDTPSMGGSTLATQIEKFRHSDDGLTSSISEKLRQMASATIRIYQQGEETYAARQNLVLDYLNTVPLSAAPGYGEVNGLGDGLNVWFHADATEANRLLNLKEAVGNELKQQGIALRQVLALMIAHRRPSEYLVKGRQELEKLTESYLRILAREGLISSSLKDSALEAKISYRDFAKNPASSLIPTNKSVNFARARLRSLLATSLYELDRTDLSVDTSLEADLQEKISKHLAQLTNPEFAKANGLVGEYLLKAEQAPNLRYSFSLFEKMPDANRVRIQTDNTDQPFDINEGSKLELGSTAKVRVLACYLEIIAEIWHRFHEAKLDSLYAELNNSSDVLSIWTLNKIISSPGINLDALLSEALQRTYSANPAERFFTGGGSHSFGNFKKEDNSKIPTVLESLQQSINLPFVRMLRDIVNYTNAQSTLNKKDILANDHDPRRVELLDRFIDRESQLFLTRFWKKYQGRPAEERVDSFLAGLKLTPGRLAVVHRYLYPEKDLVSFTAFLKAQLPSYGWKDKEISRLYNQYGRDKYNLQDQGYLARVHPLELWLLGYMREQEASVPGKPITLKQTIEDSAIQRREIYSWLMKTKAKNKRDVRIRSALEVEAFSDIHRRWKKLGYPFDHLVPSLATALGSSGDRPAALTELMGIIQNQGKRLPIYRIESMIFAENTPYETHLSQSHKEAEQVMDPAVANALRFALSTVVQEGTGRRIRDVYKLPDSSSMQVGGKTGTGDNRLVSIGSGGQRIKTRAMSRTATFAFYLGEHHFGTLTAFVVGNAASDFFFTSALPVQVLKSMAPIIQPYLDQNNQKRSELAALQAPPDTSRIINTPVDETPIIDTSSETHVSSTAAADEVGVAEPEYFEAPTQGIIIENTEMELKDLEALELDPIRELEQKSDLENPDMIDLPETIKENTLE